MACLSLHRLIAVGMAAAVALLLAEARQSSAGEMSEVKHSVHSGHFERNDSGLTGDFSVVLIRDFASFEKTFGLAAFGLGGRGPKLNYVTEETFKTDLVAAVIRRGSTVPEYAEIKTTVEGDRLVVSYKLIPGKAGGEAKFAVPLIVSVPKGKIAKASFVENGKPLGETK